METTGTEKDNKEKAVAIMVAEKAIMMVVAKAVAIMMVEKAIMAEKATMVASDSIIAHPIAIGTT